MGSRASILIVFFWVLGTAALTAQSLQEYNDILEKGQKAVEEGRYEAALDIWSRPLTHSDTSLTDPRLGVAFIRLATAQELTSRYEEAVDLYYWGFSKPVNEAFEEEIDREIKRIKPLKDLKEHRRWRRMVRHGEYKKVGEEIIRFWRWLDPTIDTRFNERLIEHWKRIDYSKKHFTRAQNTVFETDDRANIYIKYGQPDVIREGVIGYNSGMVRSWLQDAFDVNSSMFGIHPSGSDSISVATANAQLKRAMIQSIMQLNDLERRVRFQHRYPSYEIWVYKTLENRSFDHVIYIFGSDGNTGEFGMRSSLEDLMPNSAFRTTPTGMSVPPSFFLQMMFYENMISVDRYFADAYRQLESELYSLYRMDKWASRQLRSRNENKLYHAQITAPEQRSTLSKEIPEIPLDIRQYRLLDDHNRPYLATFLLSKPYRGFFFDQLKEGDYNRSAYRLTGSVMGVDERDSVMFRRTAPEQPLRQARGFTGDVDKIPPEIIYLEVPYQQKLADQKFSVELKHSMKDSSRVGSNIFKENVRAFGDKTLEQDKPPISGDVNDLEMGDLILGTRAERPGLEAPFGFQVQPDGTISEGKNLMVHFEVYHLQNGTLNQPKPFQIQYVVTEKEGFLKRLFTKSEKVSLSLNYEATSSSFRNNLEIETSPFKPGDYTLQLTTVESGSERRVTREVEFTIK